MIVGIDVGGTNTDAVLLNDFKVIRKVKVNTRIDNLLECTLEALDKVMDGRGPEYISRVVLSTTISTNVIVQDKLEKAGMIVSGGPGIYPGLFTTGENFHLVDGVIDHRGKELVEIDIKTVKADLRKIKEENLNSVGVVTKFSTRNPSHEIAVWEKARFMFDFVSLGHKLSGSLNFPRRIATTYLNASVFKLYRDFALAVTKAIRQKKITAPVYILKADGGTINIEQSINEPVQTIKSGPAASIMGLMALMGRETCIGLDIGGTTTDISVFYKGFPLFEPHGVKIGRFKTLIKGLLTRSIGVGGDSEIRVIGEKIEVGPERKGPPMAFGGSCPTITDAMIVLGFMEDGNRDKAFDGIVSLSKLPGLKPEDIALMALSRAADIIYREVMSLLEEINSRPVYTISELLSGEKIWPQLLVAVGGPAKVFSTILQNKFGYKVLLPHNWEVANAIGAALARTTSEVTLVADTEMGSLLAVEEDFRQNVPEDFRLSDLKKIALNLLENRVMRLGGRTKEFEYEFLEEQEFNMIRGFYPVGRNIRTKVQVKPGLIGMLKGEDDIC